MKKVLPEEGPVIPGAEAFYLPGGDVGCLLIHGISSSPQQMRLMGDYLARENISVLGVRIRGHGTRVRDMHKVTHDDWIASAEKELLRLKGECSRVFCAGLSMGGVISLRLATLHPDVIKGVVTICSPYELKGLLFSLVPLVKGLLRVYPTGPPSFKDPDAFELNYKYHSVPAVHQLMKLTGVVRSNLDRVVQPVLIIGASKDGAIDTKDPERYYNRIASADKELFWIENSSHVATLDYDKELVFEKSAAFIKNHSPE